MTTMKQIYPTHPLRVINETSCLSTAACSQIKVGSARGCGPANILVQWIQRPRNLDPNFTGRRFTWGKGDVKERRLPKSRVVLYLYGQQSWMIIAVLLPSSKTVSTEPLPQWWWPRERKLQILFIENPVFISANPQEKVVALCFIIVQTVIPAIPNFNKPLNIYGDCS